MVSFGTVAVPTMRSTEATLTPFEASVGNAECLQLTTETGILLRVRVWRQVHPGCHCCASFSTCSATRLMTSGDQRDDFMMRDICANDLRLEMARLIRCGSVHEG